MRQQSATQLGMGPLGYMPADRVTDGGMSLAPKGFEAAVLAARDPFRDTEPCYCSETNAHITAFYQRNACRLIEWVAAERGIDLQAEMRKSEAVERNLAELRARA